MSAPRIAALILAAGRAERLHGAKLTAEIAGKAMVRRVAEAALASAARPVIAVLGHEADAVGAALAGLPVALVRNPRFAEGLSTSLACGLAALPPEAEGVLVLLGDMPFVEPADLAALIAAFSPGAGRTICVPTVDGQWGNPVLFGRVHFAEMAAVGGDRGARALLARHRAALAEVAVADSRVLVDIDTPEALAQARARSRTR